MTRLLPGILAMAIIVVASNILVQFLFDWLRTPEFNYRHRWRENDLAVWDNRTSLHYALFDYTEHRLMHRVVIAGDVPTE